MEYAHRLLGRLIGIFFLIPLVFLWQKLTSNFRRKSLFVLALGLFQGFIGWYMVKSGLAKDPVVSPYRLTLHLGLAFLLYGLIFWMLLEKLGCNSERKNVAHFPILIVFLLQLSTMLYGGLVAGHKAGMIYNTFPLMEGQFFPNEGFFYQPMGVNFFKNPALVQWCHRILALISWISVLAIFASEIRKRSQFRLKGLWFFVSTVQFILGIITLLYQVPISAGILHQAWAVVVLSVGL